ncbi:GPO family capsid scaffolding protein [Pantoea agglomerans]|uniref:GPO family capsid scaffolding protein n=1 Tax=Enterobacter agglomerans TaxID=549 RepID=UPI003BF4A928
MADGTKKPARKKFRIAVSGVTVDGREITRDQVFQMAQSYNPTLYGARVNIEHYLSPFPGSDFSAMGDVVALSAEDITEGALSGRAALYAEIEPTDRMTQLAADGKKIYSSVEIIPQFPATGGAYLGGLAMTDTPASLGTERLKFTAQQRAAVMTFANQSGESAMFTEAMEAELVQLSQQQADEGKQWFSRVMEMIGKSRRTDSQEFSQIRGAVEHVAQAHADLLDQFSNLQQERSSDKQAITKLTNDLNALRSQLQQQDSNFNQRPASTGGNGSASLADY